jgi:hypothetical protein
MSYLVDLHRSLDGRLRPEDVLAIIVRGRPSAVPAQWRSQYRAAGSKLGPSWSAMSDDFARPVGASRQVGVVERLCPAAVPRDIDSSSISEVKVVVEAMAGILGTTNRRLPRAERSPDIPKRAYNRQWRAMRRLTHKVAKMDTEYQKRRMTIFGRSGFISDIPFDRFCADPNAAHFVAYWTARKNLRRQFSLSGKTNPMDEVAQYFLTACEAQDNTDWGMVALAYPHPSVMGRLTDEQKGTMAAWWFDTMKGCAAELKKSWPVEADKYTMIVRKGYDSSTWNTFAQAYNTARAAWITCLVALGADELLMASCPGKAMRFMAADLAYWNRTTGEGVDPNTRVWAVLPMPWEVIAGNAVCTRSVVERVCRAAGLDPRETGWTAPKPDGVPVPFEVTPELVHRVTVASPEWAALLRHAGVFSGKKITSDPQLASQAAHGLFQGVVASDLPTKVD